MGLEKAIEHGKEKRKPYHGSKRFDPQCRPHGCCGWCKGNRLHKRIQQEKAAEEEIKEGV